MAAPGAIQADDRAFEGSAAALELDIRMVEVLGALCCCQVAEYAYVYKFDTGMVWKFDVKF